MNSAMDLMRDEFLSRKCAACSGMKREREMFCLGCYLRLPEQMRRALGRAPGRGLERAVREAKDYLAKQPAGAKR